MSSTFILLGLVGQKLQPLQANGHVGTVHDDAFYSFLLTFYRFYC